MSPTKRDHLILLIAFVVCIVFECFLILAKPQHPPAPAPQAHAIVLPEVTVTSSTPDVPIVRPTLPKGEHWVPKIVIENKAIDAETATWFYTNMAKLAAAGADDIVVVLNSHGGDTDAGIVMAHAVEDTGVPVVCVIDGYAESMASYVLQSCDVRLMTRRSFLMIHEARRLQVDNAYIHDMEDVLSELKTLNAAMAAQYCRRMHLTPAQLAAKIKDGHRWYLNADEAVRVGAVDGIAKSVQDVRSKLERP